LTPCDCEPPHNPTILSEDAEKNRLDQLATQLNEGGTVAGVTATGCWCRGHCACPLPPLPWLPGGKQLHVWHVPAPLQPSRPRQFAPALPQPEPSA
jgi:hypothetical protein